MKNHTYLFEIEDEDCKSRKHVYTKFPTFIFLLYIALLCLLFQCLLESQNKKSLKLYFDEYHQRKLAVGGNVQNEIKLILDKYIEKRSSMINNMLFEMRQKVFSFPFIENSPDVHGIWGKIMSEINLRMSGLNLEELKIIDNPSIINSTQEAQELCDNMMNIWNQEICQLWIYFWERMSTLCQNSEGSIGNISPHKPK